MATIAKAAKILGDGAGYASLACCLSFWLLLVLHLVGLDPLPGLTGFQLFKTMGVAVLLALIALLFRSKLWKLSLPFSVLMFLFTGYVMGT
jgi:hypothetical protein